MRGSQGTDKIISRRSVLVGAFKLTIFAGILARLFNLQILNGKKYKLQADGNSIRINLVCPERGKIIDCNNVVLAENTSQFRLIFDGSFRDRYKSMLPLITDILKLPQEQIDELESKFKQIKINSQTVILDNLDWDQLKKLELHNHKLEGFEVMEGSNRFYPFSGNASHIVGYVGHYTGKDIDSNPLLRHPDFRVGKDGVEKSLENTLRGEAGLKRTEVNATGAILREISADIPEKGTDIKLTIDIELQKFIDELLPDTGSTAIVMDVTTGAIKALVSKPNFDPNEFVKPKISSEYWHKILENKGLPLMNKAVATHYPPGSIFKLITVLAALESNIKPETTHFCPGFFMLGNREFRCAKKGGHGVIDMQSAIKFSCNVYMFNIAKKIGIEKISSIAKQFGLGSKTGIDLPGELEGLVPNKSWKSFTYDKNWTQGDTLNSSIGQGYTLSTPLQLTLLTARIANNGLLINPNFIADDTQPVVLDRVKLKAKNLEFIRQALYETVNSEDGTGRNANLYSSDYEIAGKTATSQVISKKQNKKVDLSGSNVSWESKNHALFTGFGPFSNPKYAITVLVEHGGNGSTAAAPLVREIFRKIRDLAI